MPRWHRIRDVLIPLDQVGGVFLVDRKNTKDEVIGYQLAVMVNLGVLPISFSLEERNEARAEMQGLFELLNQCEVYA